MSEVVALLCADLHLSERPPVARSAEPDWFAAMQRPLFELTGLQRKYKCPILCAGDIFDRHNSSPTLINWAIDHLPEMYAIPGQHDLPYHRYEDLERSAYWTLVRAGKIVNLRPDTMSAKLESLLCFPFPWGFGIHSLKNSVWERNKSGKICVAVIHQYIYTNKENGYPGAPKEAHLPNIAKRLQGYDVAVIGDNHQGFTKQVGDCTVSNCGTLMRRKADEIDYKPQVGLLYSDGSIRSHNLDTSQDKFLPRETMKGLEEQGWPDLEEFMTGLRELGVDALDFREAVKRYLDDKGVDKTVKELVLGITGE